jgi:hypothetical protein
MSPVLPIPCAELVGNACEAFDRDNAIVRYRGSSSRGPVHVGMQTDRVPTWMDDIVFKQP